MSEQVLLTLPEAHSIGERPNPTSSTVAPVAILQLGTNDERAVTWTPSRMSSFVEALSKVASSGVRGLVITAPTLDSYCVGADISLISSVTDPEVGARLAREGQEAFNALEDLGVITVAAISGPCVGGGCEMALACNYRIITHLSSSVIGLPETKLGILPGFGGTYRLPRLIGLPKALDIILAGKTLRSPQALKAGLVDEIVSPENLLARAIEIASGVKLPSRRGPRKVDSLLTRSSLGRSVVRRNAQKSVLATTKGVYPAPLAALTTTTAGLGLPRAPALAQEANTLGKLIVTPQSKSLVNIYFLTEAAKSIGKPAKEAVADLFAMVVGAGVMGAGIASSLAKAGHSVIVRDTNEEALNRGKNHVKKGVSAMRHLSSLEKGAITNRIDWITHSSPTVARTGIVIEAVFENMDLKKKILSELAQTLPSSAILASNTSSLSVSEIAREIPHPERVIGMHFFNPVEKMPLVEIIKGEKTSELTIQKVAALATKLGKYPIVVSDVPGFLVNRILVPYLNEALFLLAEGFSIEEIDGAATDFGMPMGPIRLLDEVGLDVAVHVSEVMTAGYGERMRPPSFSGSLLALGRKGKKSGAGFYSYDGKKAAPWSGVRDALSLPTTQAPTYDKAKIQDRLVLHLINEAMKCLHEGVAGDDKTLAKKQIDLGTVMGIGFPPFRGGVMHYADSIGLDQLKSKLEILMKEFGIRYEPFTREPR